MTQSPPREERPPIQQLQTVADLLETPALARLYVHVLVGRAAQLLDTGKGDNVVRLTTDKPAGRVVETLLPQHGFSDCIDFQYVSVEYLETFTAGEGR